MDEVVVARRRSIFSQNPELGLDLRNCGTGVREAANGPESVMAVQAECGCLIRPPEADPLKVA